MLKHFFILAVSSSFIAGGAVAQVSSPRDFWESCGQPQGSDAFAACMALLDGAFFYTQMQDTDLVICPEGGPTLNEVATLTGDLGKQGALEEYQDMDVVAFVQSVLVTMYPCSN